MSLNVARALDTTRSVVVEACAGSGKTWLLSSRIARALVEGVAPRSILALTFTNKAAAEMRLRVVKHLEEMASASPDELTEKLSQWGLTGDALARAMETAPTALARFLSDPQPPTIATFHSWYIQLAAMAPLSTAGWATMALSPQRWDLMRRAWQRFFAHRVSSTPYIDLVAMVGSSAARDAMNSWVQMRMEWRAFRSGHPAPKAVSFAELQHQIDQDVSQFYVAHRDRAGLLGKAYQGASKREAVIAALADWRPDNIGALYGAMTSPMPIEDQLASPDGPMFRPKWNDRFVRKEDLTRWGAQAESIKEEVNQLIAALCLMRERHARETARFRDYALEICGGALGQCLDEVMAQGHEVDFSVYESIAWELLVGRFASEFQARLDTRMTHILVDEFQDTNPVQWVMLKAWFSEYLQDDPSVIAARPKVFLVGDPKQSIYRFRRADPQLFRIACQWLCDHFQADQLVTNTTRRCSQAVVDLLNQALPDIALGGIYQTHDTLSPEPGFVARLPLVQPESGGSRRAEGDQIARALMALRQKNPALRWSDVRILVRNRTHMEDYEQALAEAGIAFVSDRTGGLLHEPEVLDVIALLRFLAYSWSDLDLAQTLKSPIFGLRDAQLIRIVGAGAAKGAAADSGPGESTDSLFEKLLVCAASTDDDQIREAARCLEDWKRWSDVLPIHDLLDRIIHHQDLLPKMAQRFWRTRGLQSLANIEAFVALALDLDTGKLPSLHRFVQELARWQQAPTKDAPGPGAMPATNAVILSTLHSAKGLESDVVILAGLKDRPTNDKGFRWLLRWNDSRDKILAASAWKTGEPLTDDLAGALNEERAQIEQERFNLLYVGMTRAKKILLLSATGQEKEKDGDKPSASLDWYDQLSAAQVWDPAHACESSHIDQGDTQGFSWPGLRFPVAPLAPQTEPEFESLAIRQGKALHRMLEFGPRLQPQATGRLLAEFGLPLDALHRVMRAAQKVAASEIAAIIFDADRLAYVEQEWPMREQESIRLLRPDRVVRVQTDPEIWWVIDFKWKVLPSEAARYAAQLATYQREFQRLRPQALVLARILTSDAEIWDLEGDAGQERLVHSE